MAAAAKTAQEEARNKSKSVKKTSDTATKARPTEEKEANKRRDETPGSAQPSRTLRRAGGRSSNILRTCAIGD